MLKNVNQRMGIGSKLYYNFERHKHIFLFKIKHLNCGSVSIISSNLIHYHFDTFCLFFDFRHYSRVYLKIFIGKNGKESYYLNLTCGPSIFYVHYVCFDLGVKLIS